MFMNAERVAIKSTSFVSIKLTSGFDADIV